jgi:hypothetical protein
MRAPAGAWPRPPVHADATARHAGLLPRSHPDGLERGGSARGCPRRAGPPDPGMQLQRFHAQTPPKPHSAASTAGLSPVFPQVTPSLGGQQGNWGQSRTPSPHAPLLARSDFFDLRESGYTGPIDQNGDMVTGPETLAIFAPGSIPSGSPCFSPLRSSSQGPVVR